VLTNETVFTLTELPRRLGIVGAGPIGCEMAQSFARFGAKVSLVEAGEQVLGREDRDAALRVEAALRRDGVAVYTGARLSRIESRGGGDVLVLEKGDERLELTVDVTLMGVGRVPNLEGLGLDAAGVGHDRRGVSVDDHLRTSNRRIFAAGDVCSRFKFTHAADAMARIVIRNALFLGRARMSALNIPWTTYTSPEIAHVGLYEHEARQRGHEVETLRFDLEEVDRVRLDGDGGLLKVHLRKGSDRILGATLVARNAGDMISELSVAMAAGAGLRTLADTIHPYPTQAEVFKRAGDAYNRSRLTPTVKRLLQTLLRLQ
jgi:pyruvate/2-oxoglutarate dehydrogenase complex dihydrolipoamide dehydrogenase (E3) component